jgi:hypothetical protein
MWAKLARRQPVGYLQLGCHHRSAYVERVLFKGLQRGVSQAAFRHRLSASSYFRSLSQCDWATPVLTSNAWNCWGLAG